VTRERDQPPVHPHDEGQGRDDEDDAALPVEALLAPPQGLPHEEQPQVGEDEAARQGAAEIPPQGQMQARQHQRQDLVLQTLVEKECEGGHGRGLPGG